MPYFAWLPEANFWEISAAVSLMLFLIVGGHYLLCGNWFKKTGSNETTIEPHDDSDDINLITYGRNLESYRKEFEDNAEKDEGDE